MTIAESAVPLPPPETGPEGQGEGGQEKPGRGQSCVLVAESVNVPAATPVTVPLETGS